ncbi:MAG TPA: cupredoxin domain-containing protein [Burkholderiales bacterium]|nr:cupredoxin domain-containing protein [Burkholderiales bacterium]
MKLSQGSVRLAVAMAILVVGFIATHVTAQAAPRARVIKMSSKRFEYAPAHLTLKKGHPVVLQLTTKDVVMGFSLPEFNARADIVPDKVAQVSFVPDKTGTFTFICDVFCGEGHERMQGTVTIVD